MATGFAAGLLVLLGGRAVTAQAANESVLSVDLLCQSGEVGCTARARGQVSIEARTTNFVSTCYYGFHHHDNGRDESPQTVVNCNQTTGYCDCPEIDHEFNSTGKKWVSLHFRDEFGEEVRPLTRTRNVTVESELPEVDVNVYCNICLEVGVNYLFEAAVPASAYPGDVNFTWDFGDGTTDVVAFVDEGTSPSTQLNHTFNETGEFVVSASAENSRSAVGGNVTVGVWARVQEVEIEHPYDQCQVGSELTYHAASDNASYFDWKFTPEIGEPMELYGVGDNATYLFNQTGTVNVSVVAWNHISRSSTWSVIDVILPPPDPVPERVARAAAISVPLVVAGVVVAVSVTSFLSHRWYMSRKGVEVARFSIIGDDALNMHRSLHSPRRSSLGDRSTSLLQSLRESLTSPRRAKYGDGSAVATYDTL